MEKTRSAPKFYKNKDVYNNHLCEIDGKVQPYNRASSSSNTYRYHHYLTYIGEGVRVSHDVNGITQVEVNPKKTHFFRYNDR